MSPLNKHYLRIFLVSGLIGASIMAGFDYKEGLEFSTHKFFIHFIIFGVPIGLTNKYFSKKEQNKDE